MAPTPLIPNGVYKIRNGQFVHLDAELSAGSISFRLEIIGTIESPSNKRDQVCVMCSGGRYSLLQ